MTTWLAGGVLSPDPSDEFAALRSLVDDIGRRATPGAAFDSDLWRTLEETGLARLSAAAGPGECAVVLSGLARHAANAPVAETDLLAGWLATQAGIEVPETGPLTAAIGEATQRGDRVSGAATAVPWLPPARRVLLAAQTTGPLLVTAVDPDELQRIAGHNLAGEPRDAITFDLPARDFTALDPAVAAELIRRGAWARCVQTIGALDAAAQSCVAHTRQRTQFGRPLASFQSVQER